MAQKGGGGGGGANNGVPVITSVTPNSGPANVYNPITITGSGFTGASAILIGGTSLGTGDWVVVNDTTITTQTPQGAAGPVSVQVTTAGGTSVANKLYTYLPSPPGIAGVEPNTGSAAGGTKVTITGSGFTGATNVTIGGVPVTGISIKGDTSISGTTGAGTAGTASVSVTNSAGASAPNKLFTYIAPGTINFTQILGQPTDTNATLNVQSSASIDMYYQYGTASGNYTATTPTVTTTADPYTPGAWVAQSVIGGLNIDTEYYYRIQYRPAGSTAAFTPGTERMFHTQRKPGSSFVFTVQGDSHPERVGTMFHSDLYNQTLQGVAAVQADFHITNGDDFSVQNVANPYAQAPVVARYTLQLPYWNQLTSGALFLGTGNHEQTSLYNYLLPDNGNNDNQVPIWAQNARNLYYPMPGPNDPITGSFYTGDQTQLPKINGNLRDYYAWTWGDALFMVIDPYWGSPAQVDSGLNDQATKTSNDWLITAGNEQYDWMAQTLKNSTAKWKFVFVHHILGTNRGGVEQVPYWEFGGLSGNGTPGFAANRQPCTVCDAPQSTSHFWPETIEQLLEENNVTIFFQAHDHIYVHQTYNNVTFQSVPNPGDNTYYAFNADAYVQPTQTLYPNAGFLKVMVQPTGVNVQYIREWLPADAARLGVASGTVQDSYTIGALAPTALSPTIAPSGVVPISSTVPTIQPGSWTTIYGTNLAASAVSWTGNFPTSLAGTSVTINGKPAYLSYVSPAQIDLQAPSDTTTGLVPVVVNTPSGTATSTVTLAPVAPSFALVDGKHVAGIIVRSDGSGAYGGGSYDYIGPTGSSLGYPTVAAKAGDTLELFAVGLGPTNPAVPAGKAFSGSAPTVNPVTLLINNAIVPPTYSGMTSAGLYQINLTVPAGLGTGDVPLSASVGGSETQSGVVISLQ
jgi:uncharacterized protein (TIGR03437 family)